jgi:3-oxoadipate enol-lactonase
MPYLDIEGARIHYTDTGGAGETLVFSHGLLMNSGMFDAQVDHFKSSFRCIAYDHRGQGQSSVAESGYDMDSLADDAIALIEKIGAGPCHFAGLSMGGMIGMRVALRRPDLLKSLILIETSAEAEPSENLFKYRMLNFIARWFGLGVVVGQVMPILFGKSFMADPSRAEERARWRKSIGSGDRIGITKAVKGVIDRRGVIDDLGKIATPTLIIVGEEDTATVPAKSERMHAAIPGSKLARIPKAGHSSTIEEPDAVNAAIGGFLKGQTGDHGPSAERQPY